MAASIKKILCCASLVKDLVIALAFSNMGKLEEVMAEPEGDAFIAAAEALTAKLS